MPQRHVLLTNDDGIQARGLAVLQEAVESLAGFRVTVAAPSEQQSASSHSLTLTTPVRVIEHGPHRYAVTGTPTDTVLVAVAEILKDDPPDLVLSGINHGPNMGEDVLYSGTVAAAMEGTMLGIPSVAISLAAWHPSDFSGAAAFVRNCLPRLLDHLPPRGALLNVNVPEAPPEEVRGVKVVKLGSRVYHDVITTQTDPRGRPYLWIGGRGPTWQEDPESDYAAVQAGYVSLTPLMIDLTHHGLLRELGGLSREGGLSPSSPCARGGEADG